MNLPFPLWFRIASAMIERAELPVHTAGSRNSSRGITILFSNLLLNAGRRFHDCFSSHTLKRMYSPLDVSVKTYIIKNVSSSRKNYDLVLLFAALADRTRLRLLNLMDGKEVCVCYFVEILRQSQPKISRHLAYLRRAGVVVARRDGKWMHYRIVPPTRQGAAQILRETLSTLRDDREMQSDRLRLDRACCVSQSIALDGAPLPTSVEETGCIAC